MAHSLDATTKANVPGEDISYVAATAKFFLAIRQAIDNGRTVTISWEDITGVVQ